MTKATGVRARVRAELTAEIKEAARRQLVTDGAGGLSLRAISRELDMASSAIYRYFSSRDELLTALIIDAYNAAGDAAEKAGAAVPTDDYRARFLAVTLAVRTWAISNPHEYALIYGSPVPGYAAPQDTIDPASRVPTTLITILVERFAGPSGTGKTAADIAKADPVLDAALEELSGFVGHSVSPELLGRGVRAWGEIFGLISLELFGHFNNTVTRPDDFFEHAMNQLADRTLAV